MNPRIKKFLFKVGEWIGLGVTFGIVASLWINTEVERRMNELMPVIGDDPAVVEAVGDIENIEGSVSRIEAKVDAFSGRFIAYLERQAND